MMADMTVAENIRETLKNIIWKQNYKTYGTRELLNEGASFMSLTSLLPDTVLGSHTLSFEPENIFSMCPTKNYFQTCISVIILLMAIVLCDLLPSISNWLLNILHITFGYRFISNKEHLCPLFQMSFIVTWSSRKHKYYWLLFKKINGLSFLGQ